MTRWRTLAGVALMLAAGEAVASPGLVRTVRCSSSSETARVVVDLSRPLAYQVRLAPDSTVLVVEIAGAVAEASLGEIQIGDAGIRSVVTRTLDAGTEDSRVEVSLRLDAHVSWKDFSLPAERGKPARIVMDIQRAADFRIVPPVTSAESTVAITPDPAPAGASSAPAESRPDSAPVQVRSTPAIFARPFVVAIDAGHGGHDTGTIGKYGLVEKRLCLDIAERIEADLNARPGMRAVLTRRTDVFLTLPQRNEIAEKLGADVFVSIHLNSAPSSSARGAEIFFVAPAGAARAASQEMTSGDAVHDFGLEGRDDVDDVADIVHMLLDVNQQAVLARSEALAASILEEVRDNKLLPTRTVKQKSFSVLRTISMPSVLVEGGFLSNTSDANLIRTADGRNRLAHAIAEGVADFLRANPPQRGTNAATRAIVHRVQNGDTLSSISKRYKTTVTRICQLNGFHTSQQLHVGQEIVVQR